MALSQEQIISIENENIQTLQRIKNSGPGYYEFTYKYIDQNNNVHSIPYNINLGDVDSSGSINYNGVGAGNWDYQYTNSYLANNNHNSIDIGYNADIKNVGFSNNYFFESTSKLSDDLKSVFNLDNMNQLYDGFSYSADFIVRMGADRANRGNLDNFYVLSIEEDDQNGTNRFYLSEAEREAYKKANATIIYAYAQDYWYNKKRRQDIINSYDGIHMLDIKINVAEGNVSGMHVLPKALLSEAGMTNIANGDFDFTQLPTTFYFDRNKETYHISYVFTEYYVDENGVYRTREYTADQSNMDSLIALNEAFCPMVMSDHDYLMSFLTKVTTLSNSLNSSNVQGGYSSTTSVPVNEPSVINSAIESCNELFTKISSEASSIESVADSIDELDVDLSLIADSLGITLQAPIYEDPNKKVEEEQSSELPQSNTRTSSIPSSNGGSYSPSIPTSPTISSTSSGESGNNSSSTSSSSPSSSPSNNSESHETPSSSESNENNENNIQGGNINEEESIIDEVIGEEEINESPSQIANSNVSNQNSIYNLNSPIIEINDDGTVNNDLIIENPEEELILEGNPNNQLILNDEMPIDIDNTDYGFDIEDSDSTAIESNIKKTSSNSKTPLIVGTSILGATALGGAFVIDKQIKKGREEYNNIESNDEEDNIEE